MSSRSGPKAAAENRPRGARPEAAALLGVLAAIALLVVPSLWQRLPILVLERVAQRSDRTLSDRSDAAPRRRPRARPSHRSHRCPRQPQSLSVAYRLSPEACLGCCGRSRLPVRGSRFCPLPARSARPSHRQRWAADADLAWLPDAASRRALPSRYSSRQLRQPLFRTTPNRARRRVRCPSLAPWVHRLTLNVEEAPATECTPRALHPTEQDKQLPSVAAKDQTARGDD